MTEQMQKKRGRPRKGETRTKRVPKPNGRPLGRKPVGLKGTIGLSLGRPYIALLASIAEAEQRTMSAVARELIDRLRVRFGKLGHSLPAATFDLEEKPFNPNRNGDGEGDDASFTLGAGHKALLQAMAGIRETESYGVGKDRRLRNGKTPLIRDEIDRYAAEHGYEPVAAPIAEVAVSLGSSE